MSTSQKKSLRTLRKPRHGWFDYEVLDYFGDELGPFGCMVYMVLARLCFGGTRVCIGLREMAEHCRMGKDKVSDRLQAMTELGLIIEIKGRTLRSSSCYDLVDVKDLVEELIAIGRLTRRNPPSVGYTDSRVRQIATAPQESSGEFSQANHRINAGDPSTPAQFRLAGITDISASAEAEQFIDDCLRDRQLIVDAPKEPSVGPSGHNCLPGRTQLSAPPDALIKKEELTRKVQTPLPPVPGGAARSQGETTDWESLNAAVAKVMRECSLSNPRLAPVIERALRAESDRVGIAPNWNEIAERMIAARAEYLAIGDKGMLSFTVGPRKFFADGIWLNTGAWAIDLKEKRRRF